MSEKTFRGKRVNLSTLFPVAAAKQTNASVAQLKVALAELSDVLKKGVTSNTDQLADLSNMESL